MENDEIPTPSNKKGTRVAIKKRKIKSAKEAAAEKGRTYSIYSLNLADTLHE